MAPKQSKQYSIKKPLNKRRSNKKNKNRLLLVLLVFIIIIISFLLLFDTHTNKKKYQTGRTTLPLPHSTQHLVIQELNSIKSPLLLTNTLSSISTTIVSQKNMSIETSKNYSFLLPLY